MSSKDRAVSRLALLLHGEFCDDENCNGVIDFMPAAKQQFGAMMPGAPQPKKVHEIPDDAQCDKHGGHWGDDETCDKCTDDEGDPKRYRKPPKHLTQTQGMTFDSDLERMQLQLKAGLDDSGRPLKAEQRKDLERQVELRTQEIEPEQEARDLLGLDDYEQEARRLLGLES